MSSQNIIYDKMVLNSKWSLQNHSLYKTHVVDDFAFWYAMMSVNDNFQCSNNTLSKS